MKPPSSPETVWESFWLLANGICHAIETEPPDLIVVAYKSGAVVWQAVDLLWQATRSEPLPPVVGVNVGREKGRLFEDETDNLRNWTELTGELPIDYEDIAVLAAWAADHPVMRPALKARVAALMEGEPQRILAIDDVISEGTTAYITLGLLWGAYPHATSRFMAGMGGNWRDVLGRAWLGKFHADKLAELGETDADWDVPWYLLAAGMDDVAVESLDWKPLTADHPVMERLTNYLPAEEWLQFPLWVQSSLVEVVNRKLAATQLSPSEIAAGCVELQAPTQLKWTVWYRMLAASRRAEAVTFEQLVALTGLDAHQVRQTLTMMVERGDYIVSLEEGEERYTLKQE